MISTEFRSVVNAGNLLRTRIMLKDSMMIDPTFAQFEEMLSYARQHLPGIIVPHDGEVLEFDAAVYTREQMNLELVQIVNNFSQQRISHLKSMVEVVLADEIQRIRSKKQADYNPGRRRSEADKQQDGTQARIQARRQALGIMDTGARGIEAIMRTVRDKRSWNAADVEEMENAARRILEGARKYKDNR